MNNLLSSKKYWFLDGGFSNQIESQGVDLHPKLWTALCSKYNYTEVVDAHSTYHTHGADILLTSTYQMSEMSFTKFSDGLVDIENETKNNMEAAIKAACEIKGALIAISVGPYGACLADGSEYSGNYSFEFNALTTLTNFHQNRLQTLLEANDLVDDDNGAKLFAFETIPCVTEVKAITLAIKSVGIDQNYPFYVSFSIKDASTLNSNESIQDAVSSLEKELPNVDFGIGVNCCNPAIVKDALINIEAACTTKGRVLVCYPNLGEKWNAETRCWETNTATSKQDFSECAVEWAKAGARIIGGCCRTTPEHILDLKSSVLNSGD